MMHLDRKHKLQFPQASVTKRNIILPVKVTKIIPEDGFLRRHGLGYTESPVILSSEMLTCEDKLEEAEVYLGNCCC
jgi:hypothetical protein